MIKRLITFIFLVLPFCLYAQDYRTPQVPSNIKFADMQLKITESARKEIQSDVDALTASARFFQAKVDRAALYMPLVEKVFKEEGLPDDFKYLAIQESGFISDAVSTSNAVGFWQFKKLTAEEVGVIVNKNVDERKNIIASSRGAAKYLQKNNFFFNNWIYALQAYQMGSAGAMEALGKIKGGEKNLVIDKKTYWYVKKYLAHKIAFADAIERAKKSQPKLQVYEKGGGKTLRTIAAEANVEEGELKKFNKWLLTSKVPEDKVYQVIIPSTEASLLMAGAYPSIVTQPPPLSSTVVPPVREIKLSEDAYREITLNGLPGIISNEEMTIDELAELLDVDPNKLIAYNDILPHYRIIIGQVYYLKAKRSKGKIYYHTVHKGETIWDIAQNYGIKQKNLMKMNRIEDSDKDLEVGRIMWLKKTRPANLPLEYWPATNTGDK